MNVSRQGGRILDISPLISPRIAVWPGDVPFSRNVALAIDQGANIDLSAITTTLHVGAHADAPSHYAAGGASIDQRSLEPYVGPAQVIRVAIERNQRIEPRHLKTPITAPRVLLATGTAPDPEYFNRDFASLSPELIEHLAKSGVVLVGIDTPSVDPFSDRELLTHQALARHNMANLEGLILIHIPPGLYQLIALPLKLAGADASPVRAVLVESDPA